MVLASPSMPDPLHLLSLREQSLRCCGRAIFSACLRAKTLPKRVCIFSQTDHLLGRSDDTSTFFKCYVRC